MIRIRSILASPPYILDTDNPQDDLVQTKTAPGYQQLRRPVITGRLFFMPLTSSQVIQTIHKDTLTPSKGYSNDRRIRPSLHSRGNPRPGLE
jgi:hypothetical protein